MFSKASVCHSVPSGMYDVYGGRLVPCSYQRGSGGWSLGAVCGPWEGCVILRGVWSLEGMWSLGDVVGKHPPVGTTPTSHTPQK